MVKGKQGWLWELIQRLAPREKDVAEWVREVRRVNPDLHDDELADYLGDSIVWTFAKQGAALALPGAIPSFGTLAQIAIEVGATSCDVAFMVRNQAYLVFALGHCYGIKGRKTLMQDALLCMGLWTNALVLTKSGVARVGAKVAEVQFKKRLPAKIFQAINRKVGTTVLTKYGTKRGGIAVGKLVPFGAGVLIGGGFNYLVMRRFKNSTMSFFRLKTDPDKGES